MTTAKPSLRVLYLEDNLADAALTRLELARQAPEVVLEVVATLGEAIERLAPAYPLYDVVLSDLNLPDGSGMQLLAHIRKRELQLAVVIITGAGDLAAAVTAFKAGADDYLVKHEGYLQQLPALMEKMKRQMELNRSERRYRHLSQEFNALLDAIPDSLMLVDRELNILWANRASAGSCGVAAEELAGRNCSALLYDQTTPCEPCSVQRCFESGTPVDMTVTRPDGRIWDVRTVPLMDEQGAVANVIEMKRDITEHRKLEEFFRQAQKIEAIGQLAGGVAHDFNNILTAIIGHSELILAKTEENDPVTNHAREIMKCSRRAAVLTQSLLAFSRKQPVTLDVIDINDVITGNAEFLRRLVREDIEFNINCPEEPLPVLADRGQIEQVIMNLVTNSRDSMPNGGKLSIEALPVILDQEFIENHGYGTAGKYALLSVSDSGAGMDKETQSHVFEPFFTSKEQGKGTGLGLSMTYGIVKKHDGFINFYSEPGTGTIFKVYLPLASAAAEIYKEAPKAQAALRGGTETILVCEDDEALLRLAVNVLGHFGYRVIEAVDGQDAVDKFVAHREDVDLVIIDAIMPNINGKEAYKEMKKVRNELKTIFVSGYARDIFDENNMFDDNTIFINKPYVPADLLEKVRMLLDK